MADPLHESAAGNPQGNDTTHVIGDAPPPVSAFRDGGKLPSLPCRLGRYELIRRVGAGGMGAVYLATDTQLNRWVAVKMPLFLGPNPEKRRERFFREARAAAAIHHPNICPIHEVGQVDDIPYMAMAFVEGEPLSAFIREGRPFPEHEAAELVRQVALAMAEAHRAGVVHRDLKPSNIMINRQDQPLVTDFGLASRDDPNDSSLIDDGIIVGTPAYMAPEQISGDPTKIGTGSDVYALGVIFYELLTGRPPFVGSRAELIARKLCNLPVPPSRLQPAISPAIELICLTALQRQPGDRYRTMQAFADALGDFLAGRSMSQVAEHSRNSAVGRHTDLAEDTEEMPGQVSPRGALRKRRRRWLIGLVGLSLVLGALFIAAAPRQGTVHLLLSDPDADVVVKIDGKVVAHRGPVDPVVLSAGWHTVEATGPGFELAAERFEIVPGREREVRLSLHVRPATVTQPHAVVSSKNEEPQPQPANALAAALARAKDEERANHPDGVESAASAALHLDSKCVEAYLLRARARLKVRQVEAAQTDAVRLLELDPENVPGRCLLAECKLRQRENGPCIDECTRVIRNPRAAEPFKTECFDLRSQAYMAVGDWNAAIDDCTGALRIALEAQKPVFLMRRAELWERLKDKKQADADRAAAQGIYRKAAEFPIPASPPAKVP